MGDARLVSESCMQTREFCFHKWGPTQDDMGAGGWGQVMATQLASSVHCLSSADIWISGYVRMQGFAAWPSCLPYIRQRTHSMLLL